VSSAVLDSKYELHRKGISQTRVARELGVTPQMVNGVLNGRRKSARVIAHIEQLLKLHGEEGGQ